MKCHLVLVTLLFLAAISLPTAFGTEQGVLRVGAAKVDISPPVSFPLSARRQARRGVVGAPSALRACHRGR